MSDQIILLNHVPSDDQQTYNAASIIPQDFDRTWLLYFRPQDAYHDFLAEVANLPSSKTPEKYTWKIYTGGMQYWFDVLGQAMPTKSLITRYMTHLRHEKVWGPNGEKRGVAVSTISNKYLAPLRKYLDSLASQDITTRVDGTPLSADDRAFIMDAREQIRAARAVKNLKPTITTNQAGLDAYGERLTMLQVQQIYDTCDVSTLAGLRNMVLLYIGFTTGMRVAELSRITLAKIKKAEACYQIHVRRKRGNHDPISLDHTGYNLIIKWVERWNSSLSSDDPRRITADRPLWQGIQFNDTPFPVNYKGNGLRMFERGVSDSAIRRMLSKQCQIANVGSLSEFPKITPHDMRRTLAALARNSNMDLVDIQAILGHKSLATTGRYIGKPTRPERMLLKHNWTIPDIPTQPHQQELSEQELSEAS